ncbi:MAG: hypothetical protein AMXMBFR7_40810 [Planctomycetota bacterium]
MAGGRQRSDQDLLSAVASLEDADAYAELYRRCETQAYNLALRITCDRELALEAFQDAMLQVWKSARTWRDTGEVRSWILKIVARECLAALRKRRRVHALKDKIRSMPPERYEGAQTQPVERDEVLSALRSLMDRLPDLERQILSFYYGADMTQEEIAQQLKVPQTTVSFRLKRAVTDLREHLAAAGLAVATLDANLFRRACCEGPAPPDCLPALLRRMAPAPSRIPGFSRTAALSFAAGVAATAILAWNLMPVAGVPPRTSKPRAAPGKETAELSPTPMRRIWTFETLPQGFEVLRGHPLFQPVSGNTVGMKAGNPEMLVVMPSVSKWPDAFRVRLSFQWMNARATASLMWLEEDHFVPGWVWASTAPTWVVSKQKSTTFTHEILFVGQDALIGSEDAPNSFKRFDSRGDGRLALIVDGFAVIRMEAQEIEADEAGRLRARMEKLANPPSGKPLLYDNPGPY